MRRALPLVLVLASAGPALADIAPSRPLVQPGESATGKIEKAPLEQLFGLAADVQVDAPVDDGAEVSKEDLEAVETRLAQVQASLDEQAKANRQMFLLLLLAIVILIVNIFVQQKRR